MNKQDKQKELDRLHDLVFEGAPSSVTEAKKLNRGWTWVHGCESFGATRFEVSPNQPSTFLEWWETHIMRKGELLVRLKDVAKHFGGSWWESNQIPERRHAPKDL